MTEKTQYTRFKSSYLRIEITKVLFLGQFPLKKHLILEGLKKKWRGWDLNPEPLAYESTAPPLSYLAVQRNMIIPDCLKNVNCFYRNRGTGSRIQEKGNRKSESVSLKFLSDFLLTTRMSPDPSPLIPWECPLSPNPCPLSLYQAIRFSNFYKDF